MAKLSGGLYRSLHLASITSGGFVASSHSEDGGHGCSDTESDEKSSTMAEVVVLDALFDRTCVSTCLLSLARIVSR